MDDFIQITPNKTVTNVFVFYTIYIFRQTINIDRIYIKKLLERLKLSNA